MANAGSEPPIICRKGEIIKPKVEGVPAGLLDDREYDEVTLDAEAGDLVVLHSDGITDQRNPEGEEFGRARLGRTLRKLWGKPVDVVADAILADFDEFKGEAPTDDDQTLIVLKVR